MTTEADIFPSLHQACAALGTRLFTITALDVGKRLHRRLYTSHPLEYPVSGTKPLDHDGWYEACILARRTFVANSPPEFAKYFFDHALITSLGLGSCINIPVTGPGRVLGTVNLLAEAGHFTPGRLAEYEALTAAARHGLCRALTLAPTG